MTLYVNIFLGYLCAKRLKMQGTDLAKLIFYIVTPFVIFQGALKADLDNGVALTLPVTIYIFCSILCFLFYYLGGKIWANNPQRNLIALSAGSANTGFIGLPVAIAVTNNDPNLIGLYISGMLGISLYENSIGFYMVSKGEQTPKEALSRIAKLPIIYAFIAGSLLNYFGLEIADIPKSVMDLLNYIQGCYFTIGTLVIGIALGQVDKLTIDKKFLGMAFLSKFVAWPLLTMAFILLDRAFFHIYEPDVHMAMKMLSIAPIATNTVTMSLLFKIHPEKAATTVLLAAFFALVYMPLMVGLFII